MTIAGIDVSIILIAWITEGLFVKENFSPVGIVNIQVILGIKDSGDRPAVIIFQISVRQRFCRI